MSCGTTTSSQKELATESTEGTEKRRGFHDPVFSLCPLCSLWLTASCCHGLVDRLAAAEAKGAVEGHGRFVLRGHFEQRLAQTEGLEAVQCSQQECPPQAQAAVGRRHAEVL